MRSHRQKKKYEKKYDRKKWSTYKVLSCIRKTVSKMRCETYDFPSKTLSIYNIPIHMKEDVN